MGTVLERRFRQKVTESGDVRTVMRRHTRCELREEGVEVIYTLSKENSSELAI